MEVPWIPSPTIVIKRLMELLNVGLGDVFIDLGCGDGRVVIEAAKRGAKGVCIEIDRVLCNIAEIWARAENLSDRIEVVCRSFFEVDLSAFEPSIVYAYLYPSTLEELSPKLERELPKGTIVVSLDFAIRGWSPVFVKAMIDEGRFDRVLWVYVVGLSNPSARRVGLSRDLHRFVAKLGDREFAGADNG